VRLTKKEELQVKHIASGNLGCRRRKMGNCEPFQQYCKKNNQDSKLLELNNLHAQKNCKTRGQSNLAKATKNASNVPVAYFTTGNIFTTSFLSA